MATMRCPDCHASMLVPEDPAATTVRCVYCGATAAVPDAEARRRHQLEREREARRWAEAQAAHAAAERRDALEAEERRADRRERRRGRWGARLMTLVAVLAAPTIIAITVFDLPARLGYGASGADRLRQTTTQLASVGCTVARPIRSTYATGAVSVLFPAPAGCVRILAAGAGDHRSLGLRLFGPDGGELAKADGTLDPQLTYCGAAPATLRYEIVVGPAAKGRLSHTVLACPAEPTPAAAPPAEAAPKKPRR